MAFRSAAQTRGTGTSASPGVVGSLPAGTAAGDRLLAFINVDGFSSTWSSTPSGWVNIGSELQSTPDGCRMEVWEKKVATGLDAVTWVTDINYDWQITIAAFTGRHASADATFATESTSAASNATPIGITGSSGTAVQGDDLAVGILLDNTDTGDAWGFSAWSGSLAERIDTGAGYTWTGLATQDNLSAGAVGTVGATATRSAGGGVAGWVMYAVALPVAATGQNARPNADVSDGAWTPSTGSDNYAVLDEASADDNDYSSVNSNSTLRIGLASVSTPDSGTRTLLYRAAGSPEKKLIVRLIENTTTKETFTTDPLPAAVTAYSQTVTASISNYADLDVEFEIANATSAPSIGPTFGAIGTGANGSTTVAPSYPAGITAGQYLLLVVTSGATNSETPSTPSGWTLLATGASTDGTYGVDTGPRRVTVFGKEATGSESGTQSVSITNGGTCRGTITLVNKVNAAYTWAVVGQGANDSTSGTGVSATTAAIDWATGDMAVVAVGQRVDTATQSSQSLTASGTTFGTRTNRADTAVTTGNDHRHVVDTFAPSSAGGGSQATTWAYTASAACSAGVVVVRLREVPPTEKGRVTWTEFEVPQAASGSPYSGTEAETFTSADSQAVQWDAKATTAEAFTATESQAGSATRAGTEAESLSATDSQAAAVSVAGTEAESFTAADSQAASATSAGTEAESFTAADSQAASATSAGTEAEAFTAADSQSVAATFAAAEAESITSADATDATLTSGSASDTAESLSAADSQAAQWTGAAAEAESLAAADTQDAQRTTAGAEAETLTASDAQTGARLLDAGQVEAVAAADLQSAAATFAATQADSIALAEATDADFGGVLSGAVEEALAIADTQSAELVGEVIAAGGGGAWYIRQPKPQPKVEPVSFVGIVSDSIAAADVQSADFDGPTLQRYRRVARRRKDEAELMLLMAA